MSDTKGVFVIDLDFIQNVVVALRANKELIGFVAHPPEARLMPFQQSTTEKYIAIANAFLVNQICLRVLSSVTNIVVKTVLDVATPDFPKAIDVLFFATDGEFTDRVLRVSVYELAFTHKFLMTPDILMNRTTITGVACAWYWESARVPMESE
ncbi:MAG: hypothetical protein J0M26_27115 [Planctomycetes bacterium]|jgi:hypothetical protein|nr:hypothetical protein [Planctomycetota bacterium]